MRQKIFPLCREQEKALEAMGVTKLTRGEYQFLMRFYESTCLNTYCRCGMRHWGVGCVVLWIFSVSLQKTESPHAGNGMYIVGYPKPNPVQTIFSIGSDMCVLNEVWDETSVRGGAAMLCDTG